MEQHNAENWYFELCCVFDLTTHTTSHTWVDAISNKHSSLDAILLAETAGCVHQLLEAS